MKESKEQEASLSPKKKKGKTSLPAKDNGKGNEKRQAEKPKEATPKKSKASSTKPCLDDTALQVGKQMLPLFDQFFDSGNNDHLPARDGGNHLPDAKINPVSAEPPVLDTKLPAEDESLDAGEMFTATKLPAVNDLPKGEEPSAPDQFPAVSDKLLTSEPSAVGDEPLAAQRKTSQSSNPSVTVCTPIAGNIMQQHRAQQSSLINTWQTCQNAMAVVGGGADELANTRPAIPVPSPEVLQTLRAVCQPEFISFLQNLVYHLQQPGCSHPCSQPQMNEHTSSFLGLMENDDSNSMYVYPSGGPSHDDTLPGSDIEPCMSSTPAKRADTVTKTYTKLTNAGEFPRRSPRKHSHKENTKEKVVEQQSTAVKDTGKKLKTQGSISATCSTSVDLSQTDRNQSNEMVMLLESSEIRVKRENKRNILAKALKKKGKEGYIAMYLLCGEVFTITELASSKGLGIGKASKADDPRPSLDQQKIKDLKDFVVAWCKANKLAVPTDSDLNSACTERIGYARKQERKQKQ
ncbi:uncharacterized protein LOC123560690 isoform X2 [Mercenaria mercenaria]|nr:uncharacterized protein LOC123560690 isoform X2 [Mercenaria mercenaria]